MDMLPERPELHISNHIVRNYVGNESVCDFPFSFWAGCLTGPRFQRPAWSTGILIPAGFISGIAAGVLIWRGGERTKRVEEVRERLRAVLAKESREEKETPPPPTPTSPPSEQPRPTTIKFADSVALDILSDQILDKATPIHEGNSSEEVIDNATRIDEEMVIPKAAK
jgi:hypothetical protein